MDGPSPSVRKSLHALDLQSLIPVSPVQGEPCRGAGRCLCPALVLFAVTLAALRAPDDSARPSESVKPDPANVEFFEKKVRPILAARCQGCHGPDKQKGGLRLDARATVLKGGTTGPAVIPGNPKESLLVDAINYGETYQMPPKSKLPPQEIATLTEWVQRGAPWGVATAASAESANHFQDPGYALEVGIRHPRSLLEFSAPQEHFASGREAGALRLGAEPD